MVSENLEDIDFNFDVKLLIREMIRLGFKS